MASTSGSVQAHGAYANGAKTIAQTTDYPAIDSVTFEDGEDPITAILSYTWNPDEDQNA